MSQSVVILSDAEVSAAAPPGEEAGFGTLATARGPLPLKALDVQARIDGLLARTAVRQTFVNTHAEPLEATYIFPLPDRAAVTRFRLEVAGRVVEGVLKERGRARQDYAAAVREGRRAAITEEERPGVFTLRVGNLMPGEEATVRLTLTGPLPYADGEATYRFPLVVAPRYIPGTPLEGPSVGDGTAPDTDAVPDASRITPPVLLPGFPNPVRLSLSVELHAGGLAVGDVRSSLHAVVDSEENGVRRFAVQPGERLDRDFILRFRVAETSVQSSLLLCPDGDGKGEEGTFLLTLVPPDGDGRRPRPRDVAFILDRSGSMGGWKMVAARRALARMVDTLTDADRFTVYAFDTTVETPPAFTGLVPATDRNRFRAVQFLAGVDARGGTELAQPLGQAVNVLTAGDPGRDRVLVLVTDGQVGNEDQLLRTLGPRVHELRVFTLGIDQAVNEGFLKRLAALGGGLCELVESEDRLDEVMAKVHRRVGTPVLTNLALEPAGLEIDRATLTPARLPDLFAGAPLMLFGRYRGTAAGTLTVKARDAADAPWSAAVTARPADNPALATAWARGHVRELEDRYTVAGGRPELEQQIVAAALRFGVLCRFTAFVAVDVQEVVNPGGQVHRVTQPVEPAAGWAMLGTDAQAGGGHSNTQWRGMTRSRSLFSKGGARSAGDTTTDYDDMLCEYDEEETENPAAPSLPEALSADDTFSAPPPPPPPARSPGTPVTAKGPGWRSFFGGLKKKARAPKEEAVDLAAFRRRALELLQRLHDRRGRSVRERRVELGRLGMGLAALVEDLKSVGAAAEPVRPLEDLLARVRAVQAQGQPDGLVLDQLWSEAEAVLQAFGTPGKAAGKRREGFWK